MSGGTRKKLSCSACGRRIRRGRQPAILVEVRQNRKTRVWHAGPLAAECQRAAAEAMAAYDRGQLNIFYKHPSPCDGRGFGCRLGCFKVVSEAELEEGVA